jgi:hypothetical protein
MSQNVIRPYFITFHFRDGQLICSGDQRKYAEKIVCREWWSWQDKGVAQIFIPRDAYEKQIQEVLDHLNSHLTDCNLFLKNVFEKTAHE